MTLAAWTILTLLALGAYLGVMRGPYVNYSHHGRPR
jgi:hypothetical protein